MNIDSAFARRQMVQQQVRTCDVLDERILETLKTVRREDFVPQKFAHLAFADVRIPLAHGQYMLMPSTEGQLLKALAVQPADRVLEIGTGSGFLTACLATLGESVVSLELYPELHAQATRALAAADLDNVELRQQDALETLPDETFDAIVVTGATLELDERFVNLLRPGGRLFTFVGNAPVVQALKIHKGPDGAIAGNTPEFEIDVDLLVGAEPDTRFAF